MPSYKLVYFNARGRAETIRFIFAQADIPYEDVRVDMEEFIKMKPDLPAGQLPLLEIDGEKLTGSRTIARLLAERFDLAGSNDLENAQLDSFIDVLFDFTICYIPAVWGDDEAKKAVAREALLKEHIPKYFSILEKRITANKSPGSWVYGNKLTYADLHLSVIFDKITGVDPSVEDNYPVLKRVSEAVKAQPRIVEWIKKRPVTDY